MQWSPVELTFPDVLRGKRLEMGIDEAGRGPVLGTMVYGCAFAEVGYSWPSCVDDSKALTPESREAALAVLREQPVGFGVRRLSAVEISAKMLSTSPTNLNEMSQNAAQMLVQAVLNAELSIDSLFVDTVGPANSYEAKLSALFPGIAVHVSKKADAKFKVVGAASINAKVLRDRILHEFVFDEDKLEISHDFGSGYTNDPNTVDWLRREFDPVFGYPSIVRFGWKTVAKMFVGRKAVAAFEDDADPPKDSAFFAARNMRSVNFAGPR
jgi:ribonuclease H2 subunit A